jgi:serine/threonine protein kinase
MGEVYLAEDLKLDRRVALKLLPAGTSADLQARQRLLREARAASALNHPNIVTVHAVEEADGLDFIVMEYVEGETLRDKIERGPLGYAELLAVAVQAAEAVAAAHRLGIIHRDLKPGNIVLTPGGGVKVLDFGLAKRVSVPEALEMEAGRDSSLSDKGIIIGTIPYMSPEQTHGEALDPRSDIFSLGSVLYEAATGKRPFIGPSALAVMHEIAVTDPPPPSALRPGLRKDFDQVLQRALAKDRDKRFRLAEEFACALRDLSTAPSRKNRRRLAALTAALVLLAVAVGSWFAWRQTRIQWAREKLPRVEELLQDERYFEAYDLAAQIEK